MSHPPSRYRVVLDQPPTTNVWSADYFPRVFALRKYASGLVQDVKSKGGKAHVEKVV